MNDTPENPGHTDGEEIPASAQDDQIEAAPKPARRKRTPKPALEAIPAESGETGEPVGQVAGEFAGEPVSTETRARSESDDEASDDDEYAALTEPRPEPAVAAEVFAQVLSGEFDIEPPAAPESSGPPKRVLLPEPEAPKLHKVLAQSGIGSRRDMEQAIADGPVARVDRLCQRVKGFFVLQKGVAAADLIGRAGRIAVDRTAHS